MTDRHPTPSTARRRPPLVTALAVLGVAALTALAGCDSSEAPEAGAQAPAATIEYPADDGPGEVGDRVDPAVLGVTSSDPTASATKVGRRTYRIADEGGVTAFVLPPTRYRDADAAAVSKVAATPTTAIDCRQVADAFSAAITSSLASVTDTALDGLPVEDRHYAVLEPLLVPIERTRADAAALSCDLTQLATTAMGALDDEVRAVLFRSLTPLDATSGKAEESDTSITVADVGQLLAPVAR